MAPAFTFPSPFHRQQKPLPHKQDPALPTKPFPFTTLPLELQLLVISHLRALDALTLRFTSHFYHSLIPAPTLSTYLTIEATLPCLPVVPHASGATSRGTSTTVNSSRTSKPHPNGWTPQHLQPRWLYCSGERHKNLRRTEEFAIWAVDRFARTEPGGERARWRMCESCSRGTRAGRRRPGVLGFLRVRYREDDERVMKRWDAWW